METDTDNAATSSKEDNIVHQTANAHKVDEISQQDISPSSSPTHDPLVDMEIKNTNLDNQSWFKQAPWKIYISRALSAWGDRIWSFAVGIFMNKLAPQSLRLVAIYGFVISVSVIVFGAAIGNWIDRNKRLRAAKVFLSIQNISVAVACVILVGHFMFWNDKVFFGYGYIFNPGISSRKCLQC